MPQTIIPSFPSSKRAVRDDGTATLRVAECFSKTIQGEGRTAGCPSIFIRLQHCTLNCVWCDTLEVWRQGNPYSIGELVEMFEFEGVINDLKQGHHLILTGGSPVKQQEGLVALVRAIEERYNFSPIIEIENECTLMPSEELIEIVSVWNNSPKLANSEMKEKIRYKPEVLEKLSLLVDRAEVCWKFVVTTEAEWEEIENYFIKPGYARLEDICLMPEGQSRVELQQHYEAAVAMAVEKGVRVTDRMHVTVWDKKTGV